MSIITRPPVIAIMGHVDHGKSSLLDYIRKSNVVAGEAGGITQHLSAYEISYTPEDGTARRITFIDTPGHAAFTSMRMRGATAADIAILIVSAEEGVKAQTIEAIKTIKQHGVPFVVAINKIDRPNANPERIKTELMEHEVFIEGYGGDTPCVSISAHTGQGVGDLLETLLLMADLHEFKGDTEKLAEGFIIEAHMDEKRGMTALLVIKDGSLAKGSFVVAGSSYASTRIMEDFQGKNLDDATFSSPVRIIGFSALPSVGSPFYTVATKREAEDLAAKTRQEELTASRKTIDEDERALIPLIIKSDVVGTAEAIEQEVAKLANDVAAFKVIKKGIGTIGEADVQLAIADPSTIIVGFHVDVDRKAKDVQGADTLTIKTFDIIYKLTEWLADEIETRRPRRVTDEVLGRAQVAKVFSSQKQNHVLGCIVQEGALSLNKEARLVRKGELVGLGTIENIQRGKSNAQTVSAPDDCGLLFVSKHEPQQNDILEIVIRTES